MELSSFNEEHINLICLYPNNKIGDLKKELYQINNSFVFYANISSCITFIELIKNEKILLVISHSYVSKILSYIDIFHQIDFIFIYYFNNDKYKYFFHKDLNIIGIYNKIHVLISSIEEQIISIKKQHYQWTFFDEENYLKNDLSKQANDFLWIHLFYHVISHFPRDEEAKKQMFDSYRLYSEENSEELNLIDNFEDEYQLNDAIYCYRNNSTLQKMIHKALQTKDIDQLYRLRYFLVDLIEGLSREHQQIVQSDLENLIFCQRIKLSKYQLNHLKENQGKLMLIKGFLFLNSSNSLSANLNTKSIEQNDLIDVILQIECNVKEIGNNIIFADITRFSENPCEKEILFDLNTTFRLENIVQDKQISVIRMIAVNDGRIITEKYIEDTHRQIENLSIPIIFGRLMSDMNQWNQSEKYFQYLFNNSNDEDLAWIEYSIGQVHHSKGEWNEARTFYDRAYDRMIKTYPIRIKDSALILGYWWNLTFTRTL